MYIHARDNITKQEWISTFWPRVDEFSQLTIIGYILSYLHPFLLSLISDTFPTRARFQPQLINLGGAERIQQFVRALSIPTFPGDSTPTHPRTSASIAHPRPTYTTHHDIPPHTNTPTPPHPHNHTSTPTPPQPHPQCGVVPFLILLQQDFATKESIFRRIGEFDNSLFHSSGTVG